MVDPNGISGAAESSQESPQSDPPEALAVAGKSREDDELRTVLIELSHAIAVAKSETDRREAVTNELERYRQLEVARRKRDRKKGSKSGTQSTSAGFSKRVMRKVKGESAKRLSAKGSKAAKGSKGSSGPGGQPSPGWTAAMERDLTAIFDEGYYKAEYKDVAASGLTPWAHFKKVGLRENRSPNPLFDPQWYSNQGPAGSLARVAPLVHYFEKGARTGFNPIPEFDSAWYLKTYPEVFLLGMNPLAHYVSVGAKHGCDPNPFFSSRWYLDQYPDVESAGQNPLAHYLLQGAVEGRVPSPSGQAGNREDLPKKAILTVPDEIQRKWPTTAALRIAEADVPRRLNMVTDSINSESLFGGVASAVILAALWANRIGLPLRVVTRQRPPQIGGLLDLLKMNGIELHTPPECVFIPQEFGDSLEVNRDDLYFTTSWWSTASTLGAVPASRITYILQEDERMFYPSGDEQLMAQAVMNNPDIRVVINTAGLLEQLRATGIDNLRSTGISFEPSFALYSHDSRQETPQRKRNLFFYARAGNPRNLYRLGLLSLDRAIQEGVIDTNKWAIHFAGSRIPRIQFCDGSVPEYHEELPWRAYRDLLTTMDLGLSLMATPHPSYPPLDLAASGAVVVTNTWPGKQDLTLLSDLIFEAPPTIEGLMEGLAQGVKAAEAEVPRRGLAPPYCESWRSNLEHVVDHLAKGSTSV